MAVIAVTTKMTAGVEYTHTTASSADWASVSNDTYFYDLTDKLVHYKNNNGIVTEVFTRHDYKYSNSPTANTFTFNCDLGLTQHLDMQGSTADVTLTFSNQKEATTYTLLVVQGSGVDNLVFPSGYWLNNTVFDFSTLADDNRALVTATYVFNAWYFAVKELIYQV
jgi:hypothetical protein